MGELRDLVLLAKGAGTLLGVTGQMRAGRAAEAEGLAVQRGAEFEAGQAEVRAGQERARSQRVLLAERKKERLVQSRLMATAAASGAGGPGVSHLAREIAEEGELRALTALYEGETRARGYQDAASLARYRGEEARRAGKVRKRTYTIGAGSTLLSGIGTMFSKYGEKPDDALVPKTKVAKPWRNPDTEEYLWHDFPM